MSGITPRTAVITGGASGIGFAIAQDLTARGVQVMLADLPGDKLEKAVSLLDGAIAQPCDVSDLEQVEALAETDWGVKQSVTRSKPASNICHGRFWI